MTNSTYKIRHFCLNSFEPIKRKIFLISIFFDQGIVSGGNFILGILSARLLGVEQYGQFALLWLIVVFLNSLQIAFIVSPMLNSAPGKKGLSLNLYLNSSFRLQLFFSIIAALGVLIFLEIALFLDPIWDIGNIKYSLALVSFIFLNHDFMRRYFIISKLKITLVILDFIAYFGQLILILVFYYFNALSLNHIFYSVIISFGLSFIFGLFNFSFEPFKVNYIRIHFIKNWNYSKWLLYSSLLQWGSGNFYYLAAGTLLGSGAVGAVKIVQNLMGVLNVIFLALENILPISYAKVYFSKGTSALTKTLKRDIYYGFGAGFLFLIISSLIADEILIVVYGSDYAKYGYLLNWFISIYFFIYVGNLLRYTLRVLSSTKYIFVGYIINLIVTVLSASFLIKQYGINGIAVGMLITQIVMITTLAIAYGYIKKSIE